MIEFFFALARVRTQELLIPTLANGVNPPNGSCRLYSLISTDGVTLSNARGQEVHGSGRILNKVAKTKPN